MGRSLKWNEIALPLFVLLYQIPFVDNTDLDRNRIAMFLLAGAISIAAFAISRDLAFPTFLFVVPLWFAASSAANWVPRYTLYQLPIWFAVVGVAMWASTVRPFWAFASFLLMAAVQMIIHHYNPMGKIGGFSADYGRSYGFGTVRNSIRYGMVIFPAAIYLAAVVAKAWTRKYWVLLVASVLAIGVVGYGIYESEARLVIGVAILSLLVAATWTLHPMVAGVCGIAAGFGINKLCNPTYWGQRAIDYGKFWGMFVSDPVKFWIGRGHGIWKLIVSPGHVHSEPISVAFEFGLLGLLLVLICGFFLLRSAWRAGGKFEVIALCIFSATLATYSVRYPVILLSFSILLGQVVRWVPCSQKT